MHTAIAMTPQGEASLLSPCRRRARPNYGHTVYRRRRQRRRHFRTVERVRGCRVSCLRGQNSD